MEATQALKKNPNSKENDKNNFNFNGKIAII